MHRNTISTGLAEIHADDFGERAAIVSAPNGHMRLEGAGRKKITEQYPNVKKHIDDLFFIFETHSAGKIFRTSRGEYTRYNTLAKAAEKPESCGFARYSSMHDESEDLDK